MRDGIWTPKERRLLERLDTPRKIQDYLDSIDYDHEEGFRSPRYVMAKRKAQCFGGAALAAAAMEYHGRPPVVVYMINEEDDGDDHLIAVFKNDGGWGAVSKSNFTGLRYRDPVYRSLRELIMSYFDGYFNEEGWKTLRTYSVPVDLRRFDHLNWRTSEEFAMPADKALEVARHYKLLTQKMKRSLEKADKRQLAAELLGANVERLFKA